MSLTAESRNINSLLKGNYYWMVLCHLFMLHYHIQLNYTTQYHFGTFVLHCTILYHLSYRHFYCTNCTVFYSVESHLELRCLFQDFILFLLLLSWMIKSFCLLCTNQWKSSYQTLENVTKHPLLTLKGHPHYSLFVVVTQ